MRVIKSYPLIVLITGIITMLSISSCSTKKNTWTRRQYHSMTCHYNVYWNGMISLGEGKQILNEKVKDDYDKVLHVYNYGTKQDATTVNPKMDRAIKKASIGIQRHSMQYGGKELIRWVRVSYLMMGKAHFYKQDYTSARRIFDYVAKEYEDYPIHYEGMLWLAKTYIQQERYEKAEAVLNLLQSKFDAKDFPLSVEREFALVYSDFYLARDDYNAAYQFLERGIELSNDHDITTRLYFILGQINQLEGSYETASSYFDKVVKRNPTYRMSFEARMNMAHCYAEGSGDSKYINKVLLKMAKEDKNIEFLDQVYYALASIALKDNNDTLGISYLKKSVSRSVNNAAQKSTSALELADLYFDKGNYVDAQKYYDTTSMSLPKDYPGYDDIMNKTEVLSELVTYAQTIQLQDSLQHLAAMDTTQLFAMIDNLIVEYDELQEKIAEEKERGGTYFIENNSSSTSTALGGGGWYFYNNSALSSGRSAFKQKWGDRELEDMWRLSDKRAVMQGFEEDLTDEAALNDSVDSTSVVITPRVKNPRDRNFYLQDIPSTDEELAISDSLIVESYTKLAYLYLEALRDTSLARETYHEFQDKYPDNKYRIESWYSLYKIYAEQNNAEKADHYATLIINNYPESNYAKVITDPDYFIKLSQSQNEASLLYSKAYKAFNREQYYRVIKYADQAIDLYPEDTAVVPRFMYLRAISLGAVNVADSLYNALVELVLKYPDNSIKPLAGSVIKTLQLEYGLGVPSDTSATGISEKTESLFKYIPDEMHLVVIVVQTESINIGALKVRISDFDKKYFRLKRLRVKSLMLDDTKSIITVGNFGNANEARNYLLALKNDEYVVSGLQNKDVITFSISASNYPIFYREKNIGVYQEFFDANYGRN